MQLTVKPISTDVTVHVFYQEPILRLVEDTEKRITLIRKLQNAFALRLDDIKINRESLSGNYFHFIRGYGSTLLDVSFGLEEATSKIIKAESEKQILDLNGSLFKILDEIPISILGVIIASHLSAEGDSELFLASLNPNSPEKFRDMLKGRGLQYHLEVPEHNLKIFVTVASSVPYENAIFLYIDSHFAPYIYDFESWSKIVRKYYALSLDALGIEIKAEE